MLSVRFTWNRLVVLIKGSIYVYNLKNMELINTLNTSKGNVIAFAVHENYVAYNSPTNPGDIYLASLDTAIPVTLIHCHSSAVQVVDFHPRGHLIATASAKGTVIRVITTSDGELVTELRRGYIPASIVSISFHPVEPFLACASENGTIHVFKISKQPSDPNSSPTSSVTVSSSWSKYLTSNVAKVWDTRKEFATAKIPEASFYGKIIFSSSGPHIQVASYSGHYYRFAVNLKNGGNCALLERYM